MKTFIHVSIWIASLLLLHSLATPTASARSSALLHVSATVTPWLEFSAQQHVQSYRVDAEDLERGFVDLPRALTIRVQSNVRHPIAFRLLGNGGQQIAICESGTDFSPATENLLMVEATRAREALSKSLDIRVMLSGDMKIGRYPLLTTLIPEAY